MASERASDDERKVIMRARNRIVEKHVERVRQWNVDRIEDLLIEPIYATMPITKKETDISNDWGLDIVRRQIKGDVFARL
jgi:hypothetical protein